VWYGDNDKFSEQLMVEAVSRDSRSRNYKNKITKTPGGNSRFLGNARLAVTGFSVHR
jgi:hypothetical protein